jgi:manganese oxidase
MHLVPWLEIRILLRRERRRRGNFLSLFVALIISMTFMLGSECLATTRHYYIAAEDLTWDYAPSGRDLIHGGVIPYPWTSQTKWSKSRYIEYTDSTFSIRKPQAEWLGILGPEIRAEVGDTIVVDFLNRGRSPHSIHPHGLHYDKDNEGSMYIPAGRGGAVPPGGKFTYKWLADEGSGPGPGELSSKVWWYHAHTDESKETNLGLLGPIIITAKGQANPDGSPKGVDREFVTLFMMFDELKGKNVGQFHSINGFIYGNLPGLVMKRGEKVRWYLLGMGSEQDIHTPHWHGKTVSDKQRTTDVIELLPGSMVTVDMLADNIGTWLFHCHVADHMEAGMMATYTIYEPFTKPCPIKFVRGDFWSKLQNFSLTVENISGKPISNLELEAEQFLAPQYLHQPFEGHSWVSSQRLAVGEQRELTEKSYAHDAGDAILGWVFLPRSVEFTDGTSWKPHGDGDCFGDFWRDLDHPKLEVLPPLQREMNVD